MQEQAPRPVRVAVLNDYALVVAGLAGLLEPYQDRVVVAERSSQLMPVSDVDVVLYDTFGRVPGDSVDIGAVRRGTDAKLLVFSWNSDRGLIQRALAKGASGFIAKSAGAVEVVEAIERVHRGETGLVVQAVEGAGGARDTWPGKAEGLTAREAEVVALITRGLSNQEIADTCYLSINSVKTYIRTAYRKMGLTRRAQAVRWGLEHGFEPDRFRSIN